MDATLSIQDWAGDAMSSKGDLTGATVGASSYFDGTTMLSLNVSGSALPNPFLDRGWESPASNVTWELDTDGDDEVEFTAIVRRIVDRTHGDRMVVTTSPFRSCASLAQVQGTYEAVVERRCFDYPTYLRARVRLHHETPAGVSSDVAPQDGGWSLPWTEGGNSTPLGPAPDGFWTVAADGGVFSYGAARFHGSTGAIVLNRPIVGMAALRTGSGYWFVASDGGVFTYGDAAFHGSTGDIALNKPIVGMAASPSGNGYWLVASDGGVFTFGDAAFHGSTGDIGLNKPIVGMAASRSGNGYWLVASDGGVFAFGDASFHGSTGHLVLAQPIVGMTATPTKDGYWFIARDGGVFAFGAAPFLGSAAGASSIPVVGMAASPGGDGYRLAYADGAVRGIGNAITYGAASIPLTKPVVGAAVHS